MSNAVVLSPCKHCRIDMNDENSCGSDHVDLCCDCFDLSWGMPLADLNAERAAKNLPPIEQEWPAK